MELMKSKKSKIIIIVSILVAVALIAAGIVTAVLLGKGNKTCKNHIDQNGDGKCDICGADMTVDTPDKQYEDKLEPISKYYITAKEGDGYAVTAPKYVIKGQSFSFSVKYSNYFDSTKAVVYVNGSEVTPEADGNYNVNNVQENVEIKVSGLVRTHYGVIKTSCLGAKVVGDDRVAVDGDYSFTLDIADVASGTPVVKANGDVISAADGRYNIVKPNRNLIIEVSGLTVPLVNVTYDTSRGYAIETIPTVVGDSLYFSVHIDKDHENHTPLVVKVNGDVIEPENGIYVVANAPKDVSIEVDGIVERERITITFENCDLLPTSIYKATAWQEVVPSREGYIFNGWKDASGNSIEFDFMSNVTMYASWITENGVDYIKELPIVKAKIAARYGEINGAWWRLNVSDKEMADRYVDLLGHYTEFERNKITTDAITEDFISKTAYVSSQIVGKNFFYGANENAVMLFFNVNGEMKNKGASLLRTLSNGDDMDGIRYNIQEKNENGSTILDYSLNFGKYNFKKLCDINGKVTFWLSTNAIGLTASVGDESLFDAETNTNIASGGTCALYRVDIQGREVFVNGEYVFDLSESEFNGESEFNIDIHRLDIVSHQYAYIQISNIYVGANDPSLIKVIKTSETFKITNMLSASYIDPNNGHTVYTRSNASQMFGELNGDHYNIQKPSSTSANLVLDYKFTINAFNFKKYCDKYGSVSFMLASNYSGITASIGSTVIFTSVANTPVMITIQDGSVFADGTYVCDLPEDVYNGTSALSLDVHRTTEATYAAFHVSDLKAGPRNTDLVKE